MARRLAILLLALGLFSGAAAAQQAAPPATTAAGGLGPAEARRALEVLQDPTKRAQLIETLQTVAKASPSAKPAAASPVAVAPDSLAAQLLSRLATWPQLLAGGTEAAVRTITDFPLLWRWVRHTAADPGERQELLDALWQLALAVAGALLLEWLARRALARPTAALATLAPGAARGHGRRKAAPQQSAVDSWRLLRRLPGGLARLAFHLVPLGVFWGAGSLFAGFAPVLLTRLAMLVVVNSYVAGRAVVAVGNMLLSPANGGLRLVKIGDDQAAYLTGWLRRITAVAAIGYALSALALLFGLNDEAYDTLIRIVGLAVAVLLAILVLHCRRGVALRLRTGVEAPGRIAGWRLWLAGAWHYLALIAIIAGWLVWAAGLRAGLGGLRLLIGTVAIAVAARLLAIVALGGLDRAVRLKPRTSGHLSAAIARAGRYHPPARVAVTVAIAAATGVALLQFWGADALRWFTPGRVGARLVSALVTVAVAAAAAILVWEGANAALEARLARLGEAGSAAHSARLRTLLPMLRAALLSAILAVVGLTALSQIGVEIAPLLAGAGIIGIAVGFGAQKLVQDVITGMFVLFENAIQIGDWVSVAGLSGNVERLSVRNIWLRGNDGAVHIVPFSAVTSITNTSRGLGNAAVSVSVAFGEDSDRIADALRQIAAELRRDPDFAALVVGEIQLWIESVKASGVTLAGLIPCSDAGRWPVQREFNRRLQKRFQELGIELAAG
jgi:moderate conductance mechanosensitive channel